MAEIKWVKLEKGIRFRYHPERKFKMKGSTVNRRDRYFSIRFTVRKETIESGIGWESEGITVDECRERLRQFKNNLKQANGQPVRMKEFYSENEAMRRQNILIKAFIESHYLPHIAGIKSATQARKEGEHCSKWIIPTIGDRRLKDLQDHKESGTLGMSVIMVLKKALDDAGKSPRMIELVLFTLRRIFKHGEKVGIVQGTIDYNEIKKSLKVANARQRFLTRDEADKLIALIRERDETLADMAELSLLTAARQGEIFGITWQDVSIETKSILLRDTKNKSDRNLFLTDRAVEIIRKQPSGNPQDHVFRDQSGSPYTRLPYTWTTALKDSGLNEGVDDSRLKICWHSLRHTSASWLANAGVDLFMIAKVLGHRDLRMTQRYSHLSEQSIRDAVEKVMA